MRLSAVLRHGLALSDRIFGEVATLVYVSIFELALLDSISLLSSTTIEPVSQIPMAKRPRIMRHRKCIVSTACRLLGVILCIGLILRGRGSDVRVSVRRSIRRRRPCLPRTPILPRCGIRPPFLRRSLTRRFRLNHRLLFLFHARHVDVTREHGIGLGHDLLVRIRTVRAEGRLTALRASGAVSSHLIYSLIHRVSYPRSRQISSLFQLSKSRRFNSLTTLRVLLTLQPQRVRTPGPWRLFDSWVTSSLHHLIRMRY